uniref:Uncharacterized protein n=1 Tax=Rhizophora mucronata TaxID=61149 RepID=A0A2P2II56_RHIMU
MTCIRAPLPGNNKTEQG